jgi:hypothetical protein
MHAPSWWGERGFFLAGFWPMFRINAIITRQKIKGKQTRGARNAVFASQRITFPIAFAADLK